MEEQFEKFEVKWITYNFIFHPFGDLIWHLSLGVLIGVFIFYAIFTTDYWLLIVSLLGIIFFFHPIFYKPQLLRVTINNEGVFVNNKKYSWDYFIGFEIFSNGLRNYVYFISGKNPLFNFDLPIEEFFVKVDEVREKLNIYLDEYQNNVPLTHRIYRAIFV